MRDNENDLYPSKNKAATVEYFLNAITCFLIFIYVWIYENEAKGLISHTKRAFFPKGTI